MKKVPNQAPSQVARPTFEISLSDKVVCFDSSISSIHGDNVLLVALPRRIIVYAFDFGNEEFSFDFRIIKELDESDIRNIKLCAQIIARNILFATCTSTEIKIFSVNESEANCLKVSFTKLLD